MADITPDNIQLKLSADADQAVKSLNNLANTLTKVNKSFAGMNTKNVSAFSANVNKLATSLKALNGIKVSIPSISGISRELNSLSKIDFSKLNSAGKPIRELSSALGSLRGMGDISVPKIGAKNINSIVSAINKLKDIDAKNLPYVADGLNKVSASFQTLSTLKFNDSGLNKTINALNRLIQVNLNNFNAEDFRKITESISVLGNMPDVSSGVNRFVSSLSRLANAGEKTGQSANEVLRLGEQTRLAAQKLKSVGSINDDVNLFVQSIGRLASAGGKTSQTASGLSALSKETLEFFKAMQNAPRVSENTIRMTQALAQLATAGGKVGTSTNTVTSAFNKLASVGNKTLSAMKKVANGIVSAFQRIGNSSGGLTKAQFSLSNLLKTAVGFRLGYGLLNFGKQAFQLGSDITEVENVVDVAFGGMAQSAYDFASTAQEQFGLSELSALRYSGILMSMFNASGIAQRDAAEMSTTLTGLAGDLASFYNIDQDDAFTKLRSALAGEVEPMRALGVDMTVASMEAYALSQGITESWQSMSQAEKVMVRYNYLMSVTSAQQNDFQRTQASFANQTRLLTLNIQQLAATIGQGLIAAVLPAVTALNKLFAVLQKAATAVRNFFYVLTGYEGGGSSGIVTDISTAMDDIADSSGAATGGIGDAADAAEDLKDQLTLLPFDEINKLSDVSVGDTGSGGSGTGGGIGDSGLGGIDDALADLGGKDEEKYVNAWAERIRKAFLAEDWEQLGAEIAWGLNKGLQKVYDVISWDNVGPKITAFTTAFTRTFNSLVDNFDWDLLGRTIGTGINTVVNTLNQFITGINWTNLGKKFADGVMGIVDEVNWTNLGNLIGNKFMISWRVLLGFVSDLDFGEIGRSLAEGFNGAIEAIDLSIVGSTIGKTISGIINMFREFAEHADWKEFGKEIGLGISSLFENFDFGELSNALNAWAKGLLKAITNVIANVNWASAFDAITDFVGNLDLGGAFLLAIPASKKLYNALGTLTKNFNKVKKYALLAKDAFIGNQTAVSDLIKRFPKLGKTIDAVGTAFQQVMFGAHYGDLKGGINTAITTIRNNLTGLQKGVVGTVAVFGEFSLLKDAFYDIATGSDNLVESIAKIGVGAGAASAAMYVAFGPAGLVIGAITALVSAFVSVNEAMSEIAQNSMFETLKTTGTVTLQELGNVATDAFGKITSGVDTSIEKLNEIQATKESIDTTTVSIDSMRLAIDNGAYTASEKVPQIIEQFQSLLDQSKSIFNEEYNTIVGNVVGAWADILTAQGQTVPEVVAQLASLRDQGTTAYSDLESSINGLIEQYQNGTLSAEDFYEKSMPLFDQLKSFNDDGAVDQTTQAIRDLGGSLDLSQYITDDSFDTSAFQSYMDTVTQTASDGIDNLKTLGSENNQTLQDYKQQLESLGIDTSQFDWAALYGASDEQVSTGIANIDAAYQDYANQIQNALVQQLPAVVEQATKDYDKLNPFQKIFTSEEKYVNDAIDSWKESVLTPVTSSIQDGFEQLGIDGQVWAGEASEKLVDSIFNSITTYTSNSMPVTTETLKENWKTILNDSLKGAAEAVDASAYGKATVDGYNSGVGENAETSYEKIREWMDGINQNIHDSSMNFGSPSKTAEQYGKDTVAGYNNGIIESLPSTEKAINSYMETVRSSIAKQSKNVADSLVDSMTTAWSSIKSSYSDVSGFFSSQFRAAYNSVVNSWSPISSWFQGKWTSIKAVYSQAPSSFKNWFQSAYSSVTTVWSPANVWFRAKWTSIKSVFSDVQSFFREGFQKAYDSVTNIWDGLGDFFKKIAKNAFAPIKTLVNGIIKGINWVLKEVDSGTRVSEWSGVAFAKGSDGVPKNTLGVVNDQKGATYKELIVPPNGKPFIPKGRNVILPLQKGTKIMPANQTKEFMKSMGVPHFAGGIGNLMGWNTDFSGDVMDYLQDSDKITKIAFDKFADISSMVGMWRDMASGMVGVLFDETSNFISKVFEKIVPKVDYNPSAGVEQWRSLAKYALQLEGQYTEANLDRLLMQMQTESGGNPNAINNWDINSINGTPSKGLMQVIDPTFKAYARPGYSSNIYDPLSNILASIRYTISRYGSLSRGWQGHGYAEGIGTISFSDIFKNVPKLASGGMISSGQLFVANERGPELVGRYGNRTAVMNNDQITASVSDGVADGVYRAMMSAMQNNRSSGSGDMHITIDIGGERFVTKLVSQYNRMKKSDPNFGIVV